ncbi:MAG: IPExxxVDY family protein [Chitinophagales bacterium]|nr:IPExxxVDY family protein [Chitinophagales bacterium]
MKKTQLRFERDTDFLLQGLVCAIPDYRLGWQLNRHLGIRLVRQDDIAPPGETGQPQFSCFLCEEPITHSAFYLIQNKYNGTHYAPEWKKIDYFLMIKGSWYLDRREDIAAALKQLPDVQAVIGIEPKTIRNKDLFQL